MQGTKGMFKRFTDFLGGGVEEEWEEVNDMVDYGDEEYEYDDGLELSGVPGVSEMERRDRGRSKKGGNVLDFDSSRNPVGIPVVKISRPKEMQDATIICENLQDNMFVVVDMQGVDHSTAQRIADYLGGVAYALRGQVERIDNYIFIMAPDGAKIDSELRDDLKSSGLFKSFR